MSGDRARVKLNNLGETIEVTHHMKVFNLILGRSLL
jgi:hypothetical protein